ncbi:hypothetical protein PN36_24260 [Candidatus Thiomargarita nelsonii]|uniref:Histidine kinase n=1 Tax=Candidatus Thiomargarita nelsonii TaxID=1003181 RepID=A0A0A6P3W0_9GAMM|nr:hypothetical protein PN36_24260 [Candidatus Thiomargarita nelsonii]
MTHKNSTIHNLQKQLERQNAQLQQEITERVRVEKALRESQSQLNSILSSMVDYVFVFNSEAQFIFHHTPSIEGLYVSPDIMPSHVNKLFIKAFEKNKKGEMAEYEYWIEIGGEIKWFSVKLSPMFSETQFTGAVAVVREISERKQSENELTRIHSSSQYLLKIIEDILDFSKIEADKLSLESIHFSLDEVLELLSLKIQEKGLAFHLSIDRDVPRYLVGDPSRLGQILINLTCNAIKFTQTGDIRISVEKLKTEPLKLHFAVTDTGISQEVMPYLFDAGTRADSTRQIGGTGLNAISWRATIKDCPYEKSRFVGAIPCGCPLNLMALGTGLGLAICKRLTKMMGGEIWVESGKGSTFHFTATFGIQNVQPDKSLAPKKATTHIKGARILLVEDEPMNQEVARELLRNEDLVVTIAKHGKEAVARVAAENFDAVLMDIQMPEMDGYQATRQIRKKSNDLPIIAMTASATRSDREKCLAAGMNDYLTKPIDIPQLSLTLAKWINKPREIIAPHSSRRENDIDKLPGIDIQSALKLCGGNQELFNNLLIKFNKYYQNAAVRLHELLKQRNLERAQQLVHKLNGAAGNLSAHQLQKAARELEKALRQQNLDDINILLEKCENALSQLLETIKTLIEPKQALPETEDTTTTPLNLSAILPLLRELEQLIKNYRVNAKKVLKSLQAELKGAKFATELKQLEDCLDRYDFKSAQVPLNAIVHGIEIIVQS